MHTAFRRGRLFHGRRKMIEANYLVRKHFDPEQVPDYRRTLAALSTDEEEVLAAEPGRYVVARYLTEEEAREVEARSHIARVEPNYTASAPEPVGVAAAERLSAQQVRMRHGIDALLVKNIRGRGQRIAVIDTGCHEELATRLGSRLVARESFISGEDWRGNSSDSHGSWCASVIAAACPEAELVSLKGLSSETGSGTYSGIIRCVERARELGCTVISMSLGGPASDIMDDSVNAADGAGHIVSVAAGNEQRGATAYVADEKSPARAAGVLCVAAFGSDLLVADFSNHGTVVDLGAIGVASECADPDIIPGFWNGTSMAAPYASAIAALLRSADSSKGQAKQALLAGCRDTSEPAWEEGQGFADALASFTRLNGGYHPELPRISKSRFDDTPLPEIPDSVVTWRRKDTGVYLKKGG
jgi:subtilisin family serine protease